MFIFITLTLTRVVNASNWYKAVPDAPVHGRVDEKRLYRVPRRSRSGFGRRFMGVLSGAKRYRTRRARALWSSSECVGGGGGISAAILRFTQGGARRYVGREDVGVKLLPVWMRTTVMCSKLKDALRINRKKPYLYPSSVRNLGIMDTRVRTNHSWLINKSSEKFILTLHQIHSLQPIYFCHKIPC